MYLFSAKKQLNCTTFMEYKRALRIYFLFMFLYLDRSSLSDWPGLLSVLPAFVGRASVHLEDLNIFI